MERSIRKALFLSPANANRQTTISLAIKKIEEASGLYLCADCSHPLFDATSKFEAGCGFPSFWQHRGDGVRLHPLHTYGRSRIQLLCNGCGRHLGHLFPNKQTPTGIRYCISHDALRVAGK